MVHVRGLDDVGETTLNLIQLTTTIVSVKLIATYVLIHT